MSNVNIYDLTEDNLQLKLQAWSSRLAQKTAVHSAPYNDPQLLEEKKAEKYLNDILLYMRLRNISDGFKRLNENIEKYGEQVKIIGERADHFGNLKDRMAEVNAIKEEYENKGGLAQLYRDKYENLDPLDGSENGLWAQLEDKVLVRENGQIVHEDPETHELYTVEVITDENGNEQLARIMITDPDELVSLYEQIWEEGKLVGNMTPWGEDPSNHVQQTRNSWGQQYTGFEGPEPESTGQNAFASMDAGGQTCSMDALEEACARAEESYEELEQSAKASLEYYRKLRDEVEEKKKNETDPAKLEEIDEQLKFINDMIEFSTEDLKTAQEGIKQKTIQHIQQSPVIINVENNLTSLSNNFQNQATHFGQYGGSQEQSTESDADVESENATDVADAGGLDTPEPVYDWEGEALGPKLRALENDILSNGIKVLDIEGLMTRAKGYGFNESQIAKLQEKLQEDIPDLRIVDPLNMDYAYIVGPLQGRNPNASSGLTSTAFNVATDNTPPVPTAPTLPEPEKPKPVTLQQQFGMMT